MSLLTLVRHGQASFGVARYDQLSELGARQARTTGEFLAARAVHFDEVCSGPRQRHQQTAEACVGAWVQMPSVGIVPALDEFADGEQIFASAERHFGVPMRIDAGATPESRLMHYSAMISAWADGSGVIDGAPSAESFRSRIREWLDMHRSHADSGRRTLAFTSAGTIAAVLCEVLHQPLARIPDFAGVIVNASITEILHTPSRIALRSFNVSAHLPPALTTML